MIHRMGAGREIFIVVVAVVVVLCFLVVPVVEGDPPTTSSYTSMRALDKFGNAVPLKHAREAAVRHGRLVVAATAIPPTQTQAPEPDDERSGVGDVVVVVVSVGHRPLVSSLTLPLAPPHTHSAALPSPPQKVVAMCCTGVKSDADWLTRQMQTYVSRVWERYDLHPMSTGALAHWLARLLGRYQQPSSAAGDDDDNDDNEWQSAVSRGSIISRSTRQDRRFESSLSRPLGVQTLLLSTGTTSTLGSHGDASSPSLLLIEPTGRVFRADTTTSFSFVTMGKQSDKLKEMLLRCTTPVPRTTEESSFWLEDILTREMLNLLAPSNNEIVELLVERLGPTTTKATGRSTLLRYQSGTLMSRTILE